MTCCELVQLLIDFVSGELTPEAKARVEQHLRRCPPCVAYVETYQLTIKLTRKLPCDEPLPEELAQRLRAAMKEVRPDRPDNRSMA